MQVLGYIRSICDPSRGRGLCGHLFRGCRCAQPPANFCDPFGIKTHEILEIKSFTALPAGATGCSHGWSGGEAKPAAAEPVEMALFYSPRPSGAKDLRCQALPHSNELPRGSGNSSAPSGQDRELTPSGFHGLRYVRLSADFAPPVATDRRSVGAKSR